MAIEQATTNATFNATLRHGAEGIEYGHHLPFVTKKNPGPGLDWFDVPPMPCDAEGRFDYAIGTAVGQQLAIAYLKHLRSNANHIGSLRNIVLDMIEHGAEKGVVVGFAGMLDEWLMDATKRFGADLDAISEADIDASIRWWLGQTGADMETRIAEWMRPGADPMQPPGFKEPRPL